nr:transposase [Neptunitalea chrysea]
MGGQPDTGKTETISRLERFNGSYRRGVLDKYIFEDINQVREQTMTWVEDYNNNRPHDALGKMAPVPYAKFNSLGGTS